MIVTVQRLCSRLNSGRFQVILNQLTRKYSMHQSGKSLVAVCQMTAVSDKEKNLAEGMRMIKEGAQLGCKMIFLPECFDAIFESKKQLLDNLETIDGPIVTRYRECAKEHKVWLSLGGLHEKGRLSESGKATNAHIIIDDGGKIAAIYRKTHLFNLDIPGTRLMESDSFISGDRVEPPVQTPIGKVGLGICYDMRFAEFAISMAKAGADILTYPSAFTVPTGLAHWETLLRCRAVENQCYVIAAAQVGQHNPKRTSYGHAMVVDPWGAIIAQCNTLPGLAIAQIDHDYLREVRKKLPIWTDRRGELYGDVIPASLIPEIDSQPSYTFGQIKINSSQIFYRSKFSIAFVNHRPVLPGHVLVSPLNDKIKRMEDLNSSEISDLFTTVQKVQSAVETNYTAKSSTVAIQDGPDAGQSINQLHVHILPRKPDDFGGKVDEIYAQLRQHDKGDKKGRIRSEEEMKEESYTLRKYF